MPENKRSGKKVKRTIKWALAVVALLLVGLILWVVVMPMVTADAVTTYDTYQTETGDIATVKSFSATLSVKKSETFSSSEESTVRELYVTSGQSVSAGDPLVLLSTGDLFTASFDGVVNEIRVDVGDWLWPNFTVVQVCDLEHLEVAMNVDEYDVKTLSVGQACTVRIISLGIDFDTVIAHINRVSQSQGTVAYYAVTCDLTVPENVLPGMQATVTLPDSSVTGVTTVDAAALSFDDSKSPYVLLKDANGNYSRQYVQTGLSDGMKVEITSGLAAGQTVYVVSGTQSVEAGFTLTDIYTFLFGKKTVINDRSASGSGGFQPPDGTLPSGSGTGSFPSGDGTGTPVAGLTDGQSGADTTGASDTQATADPQATTDPSAGAATPEPTASAQTDTSADTTASATTGGAAGGQPPQQNVPASTDTEETSNDAQ